MIRPWYRSRLFWLGLPGLVFMLWLWLGDQSFDFGHTSITGPNETTTRSIGASYGSIFQATTIDSYGVIPRTIGFHGSGLVREQPVNHVPLPRFGIIREGFYGGVEYWEIWLAWWVVISTYMAVWLGALAGWQRRKARLSRRAAAEVPET
jgi:hypothetical protein